MTKLSRKERMQKAQEMAGISFWVDLRMGRLTKYAIQKQVKHILALAFRSPLLPAFCRLQNLYNLHKYLHNLLLLKLP